MGSSIFNKLGYNVFCVPEAATLMFNGGCKIAYNENFPTLQESFLFEKSMIGLKYNLEELFYNQALNSNSKSIIIYDRGMMDNKAFAPDIFDKLLDDLKVCVKDVRDDRYDIVIHLVTTA